MEKVKFYRETEFKETEIGRIPKEWKIVKLSSRFKVLTGTTPSTKEEKYWKEGNINWFTPDDLGKNRGIFISESRRKITQKALEMNNLNLLNKGDIILSTRAPVGYVAVLEKKGTFNQGCKGLRPKFQDVNTLFYAYYLSFRKEFLNRLSGGSTFKELQKKTLEENFKIPLPPFPEQKEIASRLKAVDDLIETKREEKERLERAKKKFMELLLTGKVRVK